MLNKEKEVQFLDRENHSIREAQINEKVLQYIKGNLKRGYPKAQIKNSLINAGYHPKHVELHFEHLSKRKRKSIAVSAAILLLIAVFVFYFYYTSPGVVWKRTIREGADLCNQEKYDKAMQKFDKLVQINSSSPIGYGYRAWCLLKQKKYDQALPEIYKSNYQYVRITGRDNFRYHYALAEVFCSQGRYDGGRAELQKAKSIKYNEAAYKEAASTCGMA